MPKLKTSRAADEYDFLADGISCPLFTFTKQRQRLFIQTNMTMEVYDY